MYDIIAGQKIWNPFHSCLHWTVLSYLLITIIKRAKML